MKKYIKQVKKVLAAFLTVVMVMGVAPVGVLADAGGTSYPFVSISNVLSEEYIEIWKGDTLTETEQTFIDIAGNEWENVGAYSFTRVCVSAPAELTITGEGIGDAVDYIVQPFGGGGGDFSPIVDLHLTADTESDWEFLSGGSLFAMPADAQIGNVLAVALRMRGSDGALIYIVEYVGDGAQTPQSAPTPDPISVTINGTAVNFTDQQPTIIDGRTLVPVRGVFEQLGYDVRWDEDVRQAVLIQRSGAIIITITIDSATFKVTDDIVSRNETIPLDVPAQIIEGRTMLPLRAVLESVGYSLDWDGDTQTVVITTN